MALFGRLQEIVLGYLTPGDTPRNQRPLDRAVLRSRLKTPQINVNGKRVLTPSADTRATKRYRTSDGYSDLYHQNDADDDFEEDCSEYEASEGKHESNLAEEGKFLAEDTLPEPTKSASEATQVSKRSQLRQLLAIFDTPEYKRRLAKDKTIIQPNKEFDESDLKELETQRAYEKRQREAEMMQDVGWADDPIKLYLKLTMRGWEPLFPITWKLSFESFPQLLFCDSHDQAYIKSLSSKEFRGRFILSFVC